jgi:hypothetical protein
MSATEPPSDLRAYAERLNAVAMARPEGFEVIFIVVARGNTFILSTVHPADAAAALAVATDKAVAALGGKGGCG